MAAIMAAILSSRNHLESTVGKSPNRLVPSTTSHRWTIRSVRGKQHINGAPRRSKLQHNTLNNLCIMLTLLCLVWKLASSTQSNRDYSHVHGTPLINATHSLTSNKPGVASLHFYRKSFSSTVPPRTCTRPCLLITFNVLIFCGDVQINPGPRQSSVFPCGYCQLNVGWETSGINCDNCDIWFHRSCAELSVGEYNRLSEISLEWKCYRCYMVNQSSSRYHSYELECKNSFDILSNLSENIGVSMARSWSTSSHFSPPCLVPLPEIAVALDTCPNTRLWAQLARSMPRLNQGPQNMGLIVVLLLQPPRLIVMFLLPRNIRLIMVFLSVWNIRLIVVSLPW